MINYLNFLNCLISVLTILIPFILAYMIYTIDKIKKIKNIICTVCIFLCVSIPIAIFYLPMKINFNNDIKLSARIDICSQSYKFENYETENSEQIDKLKKY